MNYLQAVTALVFGFLPVAPEDTSRVEQRSQTAPSSMV